MSEHLPTIVDLSKRAGELFRTMRSRAGLSADSPMLLGLASGFDVAITLFEESTGASFGGLTPESAAAIVRYFRDAAASSAEEDVQVAMFYQSWADTLTATYLKK